MLEPIAGKPMPSARQVRALSAAADLFRVRLAAAWTRPATSALPGYAFALLSIGVALAIALLLQLRMASAPVSLLIIAIMLSALYGGARPGLVAVSLANLLSELAERHGVAISLSHRSVPPTLPPEVAVGLFRVAEEALTNIAKHSKAASASVQVIGVHDGLHLKVEDAGDGFEMARLADKSGLGFASMQERLRLLHGTMRVDSAPSRGTRIAAWVPATW